MPKENILRAVLHVTGEGIDAAIYEGDVFLGRAVHPDVTYIADYLRSIGLGAKDIRYASEEDKRKILG